MNEQTKTTTPLVSSVWCDKNEKTIYMKYYVTHKEHIEIAQTIGDSAVLLYMYYLRMASTAHPVINDELAAQSLGWNARKVMRYRQLLVKDNWYREIKYSRPGGSRGVEYHIGKDAVKRSYI